MPAQSSCSLYQLPYRPVALAHVVRYMCRVFIPRDRDNRSSTMTPAAAIASNHQQPHATTVQDLHSRVTHLHSPADQHMLYSIYVKIEGTDKQYITLQCSTLRPLVLPHVHHPATPIILAEAKSHHLPLALQAPCMPQIKGLITRIKHVGQLNIVLDSCC